MTAEEAATEHRRTAIAMALAQVRGGEDAARAYAKGSADAVGVQLALESLTATFAGLLSELTNVSAGDTLAFLADDATSYETP